jgi:hypothetical protein
MTVITSQTMITVVISIVQTNGTVGNIIDNGDSASHTEDDDDNTTTVIVPRPQGVDDAGDST